MPIAIDDSLRFGERWESCRRQWQQGRLLQFNEDLADLFTRRAVNAGVGDGGFPFR